MFLRFRRVYSPFFIGLPVAITAAALFAPPAGAQRYTDPDTLAPSYPSPQAVVDRMLALADIKPGETVYDLGCGDGRIVITAATKFAAKAVGVEIRRDIYEATAAHVAKLGLADQVRIVHGDALKTNLAPADVVTLYLLTSSNERLRPVLEAQLKKGARVVSHDFEIHGWKPEKTEKILVEGRPHMIYVYKMGTEHK
ncbi:MAG TPA: class I SAM-dependent methyltransferase [Bryobacteraceae bacterium]|nr:class I SAM-dependent methyltransferase [Bryobacteraceae bacterium]